VCLCVCVCVCIREADGVARCRWSAKVRVTSKTDLRTYNNQRGAGKMFSVDLTDDSVRAAALNHPPQEQRR
jgi:ssDNA-binding replication factor A large subunit